MSEPRISIYTNQSAEHTKNDGRKLFMQFMQIMREEVYGELLLPYNDMMDKFREFETKINKLYEDGEEHGF
tara:strand:- start:228 stop:440 length:213 start_codon:yes stop_codon:yes gene_type:complete